MSKGTGFSAEVVSLMDDAHKRARSDGIEAIEYSHVLSALLARTDEQTLKSFMALGVVSAKVLPTFEAMCRRYPQHWPAGSEFSSGMERVLGLAEFEASKEQRPADCRDILYAILKEINGGTVLFDLLGIDHEVNLRILYNLENQ